MRNMSGGILCEAFKVPWAAGQEPSNAKGTWGQRLIVTGMSRYNAYPKPPTLTLIA